MTTQVMRHEIGNARRVVVNATDEPSEEDIKELIGYPIVLEGGIAQGKTTLAKALARFLRKRGVKSTCCPEPTDVDALAEFMKYQHMPAADAPIEVLQQFMKNRAAAAVCLQNSMMRRRTDVMRKAAEYAWDGIPIVDRGPWGDTTFMTSTYRAYGVSTDDENGYIVELLQSYLDIEYPKKKFLILRVDAPVSVTHRRYLGREAATPGNKYTPAYMQTIEDAHNACAMRWGEYVVYDNSEVAYIRSASPVDGDGNPAHGHPEETAVKSVVCALCALAREITSKRRGKKITNL